MTEKMKYVGMKGRLVSSASFIEDDEGRVEYAVITVLVDKYQGVKEQVLEPKKFYVSIRHRKMLRRYGSLLKEGARVIVHGELDSNKGIDCKLLIVVGEGREVTVLLDPQDLDNDEEDDVRQEVLKLRVEEGINE